MRSHTHTHAIHFCVYFDGNLVAGFAQSAPGLLVPGWVKGRRRESGRRQLWPGCLGMEWRHIRWEEITVDLVQRRPGRSYWSTDTKMKEKEGEKLLLRVQEDSWTDILAVTRNNKRDSGKKSGSSCLGLLRCIVFVPLPCSLRQSLSPRHWSLLHPATNTIKARTDCFTFPGRQFAFQLKFNPCIVPTTTYKMFYQN